MRVIQTRLTRMVSLALTLFVALSTLSGLVLKAAVPDLTVSIATVSSFGEGEVTLPVNLANFGSAQLTVSRIEVLSNASFTGAGLSGMSLAIAAGGNSTLNLPVTYSGSGNTLSLRVYTNNGADSMATTLVVDAAVPDVTSTVDPTQLTPEVYLYSVMTRTVNAGETVPFIFKLSNKSNIPASNVRIKVEGDGENASLFTFDSATGWITTPLVGAEGITIQPNLYVFPSAKEGSYTLKFTFSYTNNAGTVFEREGSCTLYVKGASNNQPRPVSVTLNKAEVGSDNKVKATVKIQNPSAQIFSNVTVALDTQNSAGFSLYENFSPVTISSMAAGGSAEAVFSLYVDPTVKSGNYPITFILTWRDAVGRQSTASCPLYVEVKRSGDSGTGDDTLSKPRIIISKYSTDLASIKAGQAFTLEFELTNTSAETKVNNLKVVLGSATSGTSGKAVFFPAEGSNSFFIESIPAKGSVKKKIKLMTGQDTEPGVYAIILSLEYEDSRKTAYTSEENISFSVNQQQRLEISGLNMMTDAPMGPIQVNFNYINKGKTTIYNLSVEAEGDFTLEGGSSYIGNVAAGFNDYFDGFVTPSAEGQQKGAILLKYENSQGEPQVLRVDIAANVVAQEIPTDGGIDIPPEEIPTKGGSQVWIFVIIGAVVLGGGIAAFVIIKRRKAAKGRVINEED